MAAPAPILDLTTSREPQNVRIDGVPYALKRVDDLTLSEYYTVERLLTPLHALIGKARDSTISDAEQAHLTRHLDGLTAITLAAPADVQARLGQLQKMRIADFFSVLLSQSLGAAGVDEPVAAEAGTTSSPDSPGSIPATATAPGRRKSRSGRSARTSR